MVSAGNSAGERAYAGAGEPRQGSTPLLAALDNTFFFRKNQDKISDNQRIFAKAIEESLAHLSSTTGVP